MNDNPMCDNFLARMCALVVCGTQLEKIDSKGIIFSNEIDIVLEIQWIPKSQRKPLALWNPLNLQYNLVSMINLHIFVDVTTAEKQQALSFPVGLVTAIRYGFMLEETHDSTNLPSHCFEYLLHKQRTTSSSASCQLTDIQAIGDTVEKSTISAEFYFRCQDHIHRDVNILEELGTTLTTGNLIYRWYRGKRDGNFEEIVEAYNMKVSY
jgi:hypothetical protein